MSSTATDLCPDLANHGEGVEGTVVHAVLVQVTDVNLHASVVLGLDELVGPGAARTAAGLLYTFYKMRRNDGNCESRAPSKEWRTRPATTYQQLHACRA